MDYEEWFRTYESYSNILKISKNKGYKSVSEAFWSLIKKNELIKTYGITKEKIINYFDINKITKDEVDSLLFFSKNLKKSFSLKWDKDHFEIITYGEYFN